MPKTAENWTLSVGRSTLPVPGLDGVKVDDAVRSTADGAVRRTGFLQVSG